MIKTYYLNVKFLELWVKIYNIFWGARFASYILISVTEN